MSDFDETQIISMAAAKSVWFYLTRVDNKAPREEVVKELGMQEAGPAYDMIKDGVTKKFWALDTIVAPFVGCYDHPHRVANWAGGHEMCYECYQEEERITARRSREEQS